MILLGDNNWQFQILCDSGVPAILQEASMEKADTGHSDSMTASLLDEVLAKMYNDRGKDEFSSYKLIDWHEAPAVGKGENHTSQLRRVNVKVMTLNQVTFVVKCPLQGHRGEFVQEAGIWDKEMGMYSETLPVLSDLLGGVSIAPRLIACISGGKIVLEDIKARGYRTLPRTSQLDFEHSLLAVRTVAKLHAASVVAMETGVGDVTQAGKEVLYCDRSEAQMTKHLTSVFTCLANEVENWPGLERFAIKIRSIGVNIFQLLKNATQPSNQFNVLNHGDLWSNNIMFKHDKQGRPRKAKLVDFQICRWTSPAHDLQYLIVSSLDQNCRTSRLQDVLEAYIETLNHHLAAMGSQKRLTLPILRTDLQRTGVYGLYVAASSVATKMVDDTLELDFHEKTSHPFSQAMKSVRYREILPELMVYLEGLGVFD